jgi:ubiquinone/menaquinone biosynthesis C-methylase UbiE
MQIDGHGQSQPVTEYFTGLASLYAEHRPSYPSAAIDWILSDLVGPIRVADVGCGTGISTRMLASRAAQVIGIDPNPDMLARARQCSTPTDVSIEYRIGAGERTGLDDNGVNLVVCAQSFHWFDALMALREFHRILLPAGRLALIWNVKDERDAFTAAYNQLADRAQADAATRGLLVPSERAADPTLGGYFTNVRTRSFPNPQSLDMDGLLGRARSASYFPKQGPLRDGLEDELRRLFDRYQHDGRVILLHQTEVTLADRAN